MKYDVTGMSCAACVARVEKAVNGVPGVNECAVSLLTNSMSVEGTAESALIIDAVQKAGYGCAVKSDSVSEENGSGVKEINGLKKRLVLSVVVLLGLMYLGMGHMMLNLPVPLVLEKMFVNGIVQMILAAVVMIINRAFFINGFKTLFHLSPTMDSLVALGSGVSWIYSVVVLLANKDSDADLYFESAAMIVTLITVGKLLESVSKGRTTDALKGLIKLTPKTAVIIKDGQELTVRIEEVKCGDLFIVRPGSSIPVDGEVIEGESAVDESAITGESVPCEKSAGSYVTGGTINTNGVLRCRAVKVGKDTTLSQIIQLVSDAAATKAPIARIADKVAGVFVPCVILVAAVTFAVWKICGAVTGDALTYGICVLVVSCPCALGLATPVAIMAGNGTGARNGILFKTSAAMEKTGRIRIVAVDKTGTVTTGKMNVASVKNFCGDENKLLQTALNIEKNSEHPIARAITEYCESKGISASGVEKFETRGGLGIKAEDNGLPVIAGNLTFIESAGGIEKQQLESVKEECNQCALRGETPVIFASQGALLGIISVKDKIKEDSAEAVKQFRKLGIRTVMITGDNETTARAIARECGIDEVIAGVRPEQKASEIEKLKKSGTTAMCGDGINDAPALTVSDVGIAIGAGTDIAIDAADVVLVNSSLIDAVNAVKLGRKTLLNIKENLFWAFIYNVALIPVAAGAYSKFNVEMNPMLGAAAMSLSSFCVVMNALRLNLVRLLKRTVLIESKGVNNYKESKMTKTIKVEGMMCQHCEKHVKEALEKIDGVTSAAASHEKSEVVLELSKEVAESDLEKAVVDAGYTFVK